MKQYIHSRYRHLPEQLAQDVLAEWYKTHNPAFYKLDTTREKMSPALANTLTYHLRKPNVDRTTVVKTETTQNILQCVDTPLYNRFPKLRELIEWTGQQRGGWKRLGRVFVTRLDEKSSIGRHVDEGEYFDNLDRHHFVLRSENSHFWWDDDVSVQLRTGELWMVNNSVPHWVENSGSPRTHVIFDAA